MMVDGCSEACVPDHLVGIIKSELRVFLELQRARYTDPGAAAASSSPTTATGRHSPSEWSELYRQHMEPLGDRAVNSIWGLASSILQIVELGGSHTINASASILAWYRDFMLDEVYIEEKRSELLSIQLVECTDDEVLALGGFFLDMIERSFFAGRFDTSASLIDALMSVLRDGSGEENPFSAATEDCIADIRRLLVASFHCVDSFSAWRQDANELIYSAKRTLEEQQQQHKKNGGADNDSARMRVASSLCTVCLHILLAASGDAMLVYERCLQSEMSLVEYMVAICAVVRPYASLVQIGDILNVSIEDWCAVDEHAQWQSEFLKALFDSKTLEDILRAMQVLSELSMDHFSWNPQTMYVVDTQGEEEAAGGEDEEEAIIPIGDASNTSSKRFGFLCMAAHIADLCAPAVVAPSHAIELTFMRNDMVSKYIHLIGFHPRTWSIAGTYAVYSPFINPRLLYQLVSYAAQKAAASAGTSSAYQSLCGFLHTKWDASSKLQRTMRKHLHDKLPDHPTLHQWLDIVDYEYKKAFLDAHQYIIAEQFNRGNVATAAWLAVETNTPSPIQFKLRKSLRSATALEDDCVYNIGEAVHHSFIALDTCATAELAQSLYTSAAIFAYRQAAAVSTAAVIASESTATSSSLTSSRAHHDDAAAAGGEQSVKAHIKCVERIEAALSRIDACEFAFHPTVVFTLVEHAVDLILLIREALRRQGSSAYAHLASSVVPQLSMAFSVVSVECGSAPLSDDLQKWSLQIREKIARTLEVHTR